MSVSRRSGKSGRLGLGLGLAVLVLALDQATKWAVLAALRPPGTTETPFFAPGLVRLVPFVDLALVWNRGISFGVGNNNGTYNTLLFSGLALVIAIVLAGWMARSQRGLVVIALGIVLGGALGNVIDRIRLGAVEDFLYVHIGAFDWWPAFNVADSAITVGAGLLVIDSLFARRDSHIYTK